jgi:hypothetical protein
MPSCCYLDFFSGKKKEKAVKVMRTYNTCIHKKVGLQNYVPSEEIFVFTLYNDLALHLNV